MAFRVDITDPALIDAEEYVKFIREIRLEPEGADKWFRGLIAAIFSLEESPERCSIIPEADEFQSEIRQLVYFSHRIIFGVEHGNKRVLVYRVYHGSRKTIGTADIGL